MVRRSLVIVVAAASLAGCAKPPVTHAGFLSNYSDMAKPANADARAAVRVWKDRGGLQQVRTVKIEPTRMSAEAAHWMTPQEQVALLREVDAQLCYSLSRTYDIVTDGPADAYVRAAVTRVKPTGRLASGVAAAANKFIPFVPVTVRAPVGLGALSAEAEMLQDNGSNEQLAAIRWSRQAQVVGSDHGSFSRIGDALQFASAFGDAVRKQFSPPGAQVRQVDASADPCARFGPRARPDGWIAKFATGLYVPELSKAKAAKHPDRGPPPLESSAGPVQAAAPVAETPPASDASAVAAEPAPTLGAPVTPSQAPEATDGAQSNQPAPTLGAPAPSP